MVEEILAFDLVGHFFAVRLVARRSAGRFGTVAVALYLYLHLHLHLPQEARAPAKQPIFHNHIFMSPRRGKWI